jgi:hypothetical protein
MNIRLRSAWIICGVSDCCSRRTEAEARAVQGVVLCLGCRGRLYALQGAGRAPMNAGKIDRQQLATGERS